MATSGTTSFNETLNDIIGDSFRKAGILGQGQSLTPQEYNDGVRNLNRIVKKWQTAGHLRWKTGSVIVFPDTTRTTGQYVIGGANYDYCALESEIAYTKTTTNHILGATSIAVSSIANILDGDYIGIVQNNNFIFWTTVSGTPSGDTINLSDPLTYASLSGSWVYAFTNKAKKVLNVRAAMVSTAPNAQIAMIPMTVEEYQYTIPNKGQLGQVYQYACQPMIDRTILYVWQNPQNVQYIMQLWCEFEIEDFVNPANTPDLPVEWLDPIVWTLAADLALEYGMPDNKYDRIYARAQEEYQLLLRWDQEPISFVPS